jgi:hypothetical protein
VEYTTITLLAFYKQVKRMFGRAVCAVEHPINIKESLGMIRGKNDKVDAQRITLYSSSNLYSESANACLVLSYPASCTHTFVVMKRSSLATPLFLVALPTADSFW